MGRNRGLGLKKVLEINKLLVECLLSQTSLLQMVLYCKENLSKYHSWCAIIRVVEYLWADNNFTWPSFAIYLKIKFLWNIILKYNNCIQKHNWSLLGTEGVSAKMSKLAKNCQNHIFANLDILKILEMFKKNWNFAMYWLLGVFIMNK